MLPILNTTVKKFPLAQIESDEENWDDIEIPSSGLMVIDNTSEDDIEDVGKISTNDMSDDISTSSKIVRRNDELNAAVKAMIGDLNNSLSNKEFTGTITMLGNPKKVVDMDDWDNDMEIPEDGLPFSDPSKSSSFNFINYNVKRIDNPSTFPRISTENVVESFDQDFDLMDSNDLNFSTDALKVYGGDDDDNYSAFDPEGGNDIMSGGFHSRDSPRDSLRDSPRDSPRDSLRDSPRGSLRDSLGGSPRFNVIVSPDPSSSNFESEDESFDDLQIPDEQLTLFPPRREYQNSPLSRSDTIIKDNSMNYKLDDDDDIGEDNFWSGLDVQYDNAFEPDNIKNKNIVSKSVPVQYKRPRRQSFTIEFSPSLISDSLMNIDDPHSFDINSSDEFSHSKDSSSTSEKSTTSSTSKNSKSSSSSLSKKVTKKNCLSSLETPPSSPTRVASNSKNNIISKRPSNISSKTSPPSKKYKSNISKTPDSPKSTSSSSSSKEKDSTTTKSSTKSSAKSVGKSVTNSVTNLKSVANSVTNLKSVANSVTNLKSVANSVTKSVTKNSTISKPRTLSTSKASNTNVTSSIKENFNPLTKSKKTFVASSKSLTNKLLDSTKLSKMASSPSLKTTKISGSSSLTKHANISSISLASVKTHHSLPSVPSKKSNFTTTVSSSKTSKSLLNSSKPTHSHVKSAPSLSVISTVNKINNSKKNQKSCGSKTLRIMLKPNNSQNYGDGTELDVFDDLPICLDKERAYKIYPASPIFDANSGILSDRKNSASSIGSKALSKSNAESRRSSTSSKKKNRQKKPHLIRNLNSEKGTKVVGEMVYNPILQRWDGNESALKDFDSSQRPALISNMNPQSTNTKSLHMVGRMIFDPIKMCWFHSSAKDNNNSMSSEEEELLALFDSEEEIDLENTESAKNTDGFDESSKFKCHTSSGELLGMNNSRNDELWDATSLVFSDGDHNEIVYSAEGRRRRRIIATGNGNKQTNDNDNVFGTNEFQVGSEFDVSKGFLANLVASERQHKKEMNRWYSAIRSISNEQRFGLKDRNYQRGFLYEIRNPNIVNSIITLNSGKHKKNSSSGSK